MRHLKIMKVCFLSWQDIIPVITGNESLWHSHKIDAQWQSLCSKASTASCSFLPPLNPIKTKFQVHEWNKNTDSRVYFDVPPLWSEQWDNMGRGHFSGGWSFHCAPILQEGILQIYYASASTFICSFSLQTTFVPLRPSEIKKKQNK